MQNNAALNGGEIHVVIISNQLTQINVSSVLSTIIDNIHNTTPVDINNLNISIEFTDNTAH